MFFKLAKKQIESCENAKLPFSLYLNTFFFIIILRSFIEFFSQKRLNYLNVPSESFDTLFAGLIMFGLFYTCLAMMLILSLYFITKEKIVLIAKFLLPAFILLLMAPLIDLLISLGHGYDMKYLLILSNKSLASCFITYFSTSCEGVTIGMKIEIGCALLGVFVYTQCKTQSILKSCISTFLEYAFIFFLGAMPSIVPKILSLKAITHYDLVIFGQAKVINKYLAILILIFSVWICYLGNSTLFKVIIKDMRFLRILHYELMFLLGIFLAFWQDKFYPAKLSLSRSYIVIDPMLVVISIFFSCIFAIICNNIADYDIDLLSNPQRPLVKGHVDINSYKMIGNIALMLSIFYAMLINIKVLFLILTTVGIYYLYSTPPLRLKRLTVISKLAISCNSLIFALAGFLMVNADITLFPRLLYFIFLIGFTVAANFIDIKDVEGDKAVGIKTLPTLLPQIWAKLIIGLGFLFTYVSFYFLFRDKLLLPFLILGGCIQFYFVIKKNYREWKVFLFNTLTLVFLILYLNYLIHY